MAGAFLKAKALALKADFLVPEIMPELIVIALLIVLLIYAEAIFPLPLSRWEIILFR